MLRSSMTSDAGNQRRRAALRSGAAGAADAVNEVLGHLRQVVVDDVGDVVDVQAARSDVGRHQHLEAAFLKSAQGFVTLRLRAVAVNHRGIEALARQFPGEPLRAALGAREDQGLSFFVVQQMTEHVRFFSGTHFVGL